MTNGPASLELLQFLPIPEHIRDESPALETAEAGSVATDNPGSLLSAMLQCVQT